MPAYIGHDCQSIICLILQAPRPYSVHTQYGETANKGNLSYLAFLVLLCSPKHAATIYFYLFIYLIYILPIWSGPLHLLRFKSAYLMGVHSALSTWPWRGKNFNPFPTTIWSSMGNGMLYTELCLVQCGCCKRPMLFCINRNIVSKSC